MKLSAKHGKTLQPVRCTLCQIRAAKAEASYGRSQQRLAARGTASAIVATSAAKRALRAGGGARHMARQSQKRPYLFKA